MNFAAGGGTEGYFNQYCAKNKALDNLNVHLSTIKTPNAQIFNNFLTVSAYIRIKKS